MPVVHFGYGPTISAKSLGIVELFISIPFSLLKTMLLYTGTQYASVNRCKNASMLADHSLTNLIHNLTLYLRGKDFSRSTWIRK